MLYNIHKFRRKICIQEQHGAALIAAAIAIYKNWVKQILKKYK